MAHQYINPDAVSKPANYSHVVVSQPGRVVFISGQVAIDKDGNIVGAGDLSKQAEQVFQLVRRLKAEHLALTHACVQSGDDHRPKERRDDRQEVVLLVL